MNGKTTSSVVIVPHAMGRAQLEEAVQAKLHVECILELNDDHTIEPGHLHGMSLMLKNAEQTLAQAAAALPEIRAAVPRKYSALVWEADCPEFQPSH